MENGDVQVAPAQCDRCSASIWADAAFCSACGNKVIAQGASSDAPSAVREFAVGTAGQIKQTSAELLRSETTHKLAAGAALGAAIGSVVPFVGTGIGAAFGAGYVAFKRLTK